MLATLLPPSGGRAVVAGHDLLAEPGRVRERIGYVSQTGGADREATGRENLVLQGRLYGLSARQAQQRSDELLAALEIEPIADRLVRTYSGGQRRRLDLALEMAHHPALLFLDEPTTGLDPQSRAWLWAEVRRLHEQGTSVFLTTHYLKEADALKREIGGDVVTLGLDSPQWLQRAEQLLRCQPFVREIQAADGHLRLCVEQGEKALGAIVRTLGETDLHVETVSLARASLDDVFLQKTGRSLPE